MAGTDKDSFDPKLPWGPPQPKSGIGRTGKAAAAGAGVPSRAVADAAPNPGSQHPYGPADAAALARIDERLKQVELDIGRRFDLLEEQASRQSVGLEAQLEKVAAAHSSSIEATGLLAGHLVTQLREELASLEAALVARHERSLARVELMLWQRDEELVAKLDAACEVMIQAVAGVASNEVTSRLLEGVATIAELLDTELTDIRRLVDDQRRAIGSAPPRGDAASS